MRYDPERHHRRSIRLRGYDYGQAGAYFVTICTQDRACLFGQVVDGCLESNDAGRMIERWWAELANKYPTAIPDACVVMPNHFHGIVIIAHKPVGADLRVCPDPAAHTGAGAASVGADLRVCPDPAAHTGAGAASVGADLRVCPDPAAHTGTGAHIGAPLPHPDVCPGVPAMVQWFKTMTTNEYMRGVKTLGWAPFPGRFWQRNYFEQIIRDEASLNQIRQYIVDNPAQWADDSENPEKARR